MEYQPRGCLHIVGMSGHRREYITMDPIYTDDEYETYSEDEHDCTEDEDESDVDEQFTDPSSVQETILYHPSPTRQGFEQQHTTPQLLYVAITWTDLLQPSQHFLLFIIIIL